MNLKQTIKLAVKSIGARKGRTFLTMLGVIIGLAAVITMVTYASGTTRKMMDLMQSMGTNRIQVQAYKWTGGSSEDVVFNSLYNYCQQQLGDLVLGVTPNQYTWFTVTYGSKNSDNMYSEDGRIQPPQIYMGSDQWAACSNATIAKGRDISYLDVKNGNQVCVLSARAAELFFNYADPIDEIMYFSGVPFRVIGVYAPRFDTSKLDENTSYYAQQDNFILLPYTANRAFQVAGVGGTSSDSNFIVKAKDAASRVEAMARLETFLQALVGDGQTGNSYGYYSVYSEDTYVDNQAEANRSQQLLLGGIAAISLIVGGIGIMNIMLVTVTERTREIGIRKAIGAERRTIIVQFLIEACMICGIGGILGIALGYAITIVLCQQTLGIFILPDAGITVGSFIISVGLGIVFGLYPAIKASGLQPVEALRAE